MSRNNSRGAVGALHPILFFVFVYGIALFLAFFICSAVYNALHPADATTQAESGLQAAEKYELSAATATTVMR